MTRCGGWREQSRIWNRWRIFRNIIWRRRFSIGCWIGGSECRLEPPRRQERQGKKIYGARIKRIVLGVCSGGLGELDLGIDFWVGCADRGMAIPRLWGGLSCKPGGG